MSIQKKEYELSVWSETLGENGQKVEHKEYIIGAHDMDYLGRVTNIKLTKKLNGTHSLTFQMPDKWYDHEKGEYVRNEFVEQLFNEKKVKLHYMDEWYEFYIKNVQDTKQFKSYMKSYTCSDAFIDELSRNGYGIIFDEELYNNVEEIGTFTEEILEDSVWYYSPENNWGDFTEYLEEKMYKIPVSQFNKIVGYPLFFDIDNADEQIVNLFTREKRNIEMGDDLARNKYYWDQRGENGIEHCLIGDEQEIENDGYIYVFFSDLNYCYQTTTDDSKINLVATEEPFFHPATNSYAIAPNSVDPSKLIQFMAFPKGVQIEVDEAGLIVNKDYHYVMTVEQWNNNIKKENNYFYQFETLSTKKEKIIIKGDSEEEKLSILGNWIAYYNGYLDRIGDLEVLYGKKISITDRTEINITPDIDQYVKVYNNNWNDIITINEENVPKYNYINLDGNWNDSVDNQVNYRICSAQKTRQIVPQLARNLIENASHIKSDSGWGIGGSLSALKNTSMQIKFLKDVGSDKTGYLEISPPVINDGEEEIPKECMYLINFGIVGQEYEIKAGQIYCLGFDAELSLGTEIIIAEGKVVEDGRYSIDENNIGLKVNIPNFAWVTGKIRKKVFRLIKFSKNIKNPYFILKIKTTESISDYSLQRIYSMYFFEAYTKGIDQFKEADSFFKYSGRELFDGVLNDNNFFKQTGCLASQPYSDKIEGRELEKIKSMIIFEDDIMPGDTYAYTQYFIQQIQASTFDKNKTADKEAIFIDDSFKQREFLSVEGTIVNKEDFTGNVSYRDLPYSKKDFTDDDLVISTKVIDLNKCPYYIGNKTIDEKMKCDCCYETNNGQPNGYCMYQKYGYCPYLFQTEKHPRKIRTLKGEKSNRFNLTQELGKVFETYPVYWINHEENGKVKKSESEKEDAYGNKFFPLDKRVFFITEKGSENKLGFRYELNLSNITRTIKSDQIVTKLYVQDVDSDISRTGLCSIKTAEDNPSKDSFIIDFSYYIAKGILNEDAVLRDLYGIEDGDMGYLKNLGHYNSEYDRLSDLIINLSSASFTELEANVNVNFDAIETAQQQIAKLKKQQEKYKSNTDSQTWKNYETKIAEQEGILNELVKETFCNEGENGEIQQDIVPGGAYTEILNFSMKELKERDWVKRHTYTTYGMLGQYNQEYQQIQTWKKQQAEYLKQINILSLRFFRKYEPYLKEGTWSDSNYLTDNAYYFGAKEVAAEGAIPKVEYSITVVDLYSLPEYEDYKFDIADTTYVEDIGMFGVNEKTGLPNRLKVLISEITYDLDQSKNNSIKVQNFTTQFEDLFQQVSASVQSLSFNENIYKRSSNFTSTQSIKEDSLQGALNSNNLTLINTEENNIEIDKNGQSGSGINNHSNQYRLDGQGMFFSNNGGQTWNIGVGPDGINADYIKTGTLDAGKIRIVDNDYMYFLWDKDGIVAFRDPQSINKETSSNDFSLFNRYGLSIIEKGMIRLRAGYEYNGSDGSYNSETVQGQKLGFYLYDNQGNPIFSTTGVNKKYLSARIDLNGEIYAHGNVTERLTTFTYRNGILLTEGNAHPSVQVSSNSQYEIYKNYITTIEGQTYTLEKLITQALSENGSGNFGPLNFINPNDDPGDPNIVITTIGLYSVNDSSYVVYKDHLSKKNSGLYINGTLDQYYGLDKGTLLTVDITEVLKIKIGALVSSIISNQQYTPIKSFEINYYDDQDYTLKTFQTEEQNYYKGPGEQYYIEEEIESSGKKTVQEIGLFLNNCSVQSSETVEEGETYNDDGTISDRNKYTYYKRLITAVEQNGNNFNNIFSILNDGNLYMGGLIATPNNKSTGIENLSDFIRIVGTEGTLQLKKINGAYKILVDGKDIIAELRQTITDASTAAQSGIAEAKAATEALEQRCNAALASLQGNIVPHHHELEIRPGATNIIAITYSSGDGNYHMNLNEFIQKFQTGGVIT